MSPRRRERARPEEAPGERRTEGVTVDGWVVRRVTGAATQSGYRCPGCDQEIRPGTPHVVAWPSHDEDASDRRHWHSACWTARDRRGVKVHRSKNAPHYG